MRPRVHMQLNGSVSIVLGEDLETFTITFGPATTEMMGSVAAKVFQAGAACHIPERKGQGWVVRFGVPASQDLPTVLAKLKALFKPQLTVSYACFDVKVTVCAHGDHTAIVEEWRYLTQFEPENPKAFETALAATLRGIDLGEFAAPSDPALQQELEARLAQIVITALKAHGAAVGWVDVEFTACCTTTA